DEVELERAALAQPIRVIARDVLVAVRADHGPSDAGPLGEAEHLPRRAPAQRGERRQQHRSGGEHDRSHGVPTLLPVRGPYNPPRGAFQSPSSLERISFM